MRLYVVECVLLSVCLTVLLGNSARAYPWAIRAVDRDESRRKQNTYNRLLCAVPGVPDRWEARSILLLSVYSLSPYLPIAPPHPMPYPTILLYYIVNTLTMYLSLYCVCVVLFVCWSLARWLALPCPLCRACPCPLLVGCLLIF